LRDEEVREKEGEERGEKVISCLCAYPASNLRRIPEYFPRR